MVESDELSEAQLETLTDDLQEIRRRLDEVLSSTDATKPVELDQTRLGRVSRIDAIQQQKMAEASRRGQLLRRRLVRAAFEAIERGEYGLCKRCDENIGFPRLKARPETPFCLTCQGNAERTSR